MNLLGKYKKGYYSLIENIVDSSLIPTEEMVKQLIDILGFDDGFCSIKYKILSYLRRNCNMVDINYFAEKLSVEKEDAENILRNEIEWAYFPIVGSKSKIVRVGVIRLKSGKILGLCNLDDQLVRKLMGFGFGSVFILFDDDFIGNSFELALVTLIKFGSPRRVVFSGTVDSSGRIRCVDDLGIKRKVAENNGFMFVSCEELSNFDEVEYFVFKDTVDVPFSVAFLPDRVTGSTKEAAYLNLERLNVSLERKRGFNYNGLKKIYGMNDEDFVVYGKKMYLPKSDWAVYVKMVFEKIKVLKKRIYSKTGKKVVFHFAFIAPSPIVFGVGVLYGSKAPFVFYQFDAKDEMLKPVLDYGDRDVRYLKVAFSEPRSTVWNIVDIGDDEALVIYIASHNPIGDVTNFIKGNLKDCGISWISLKENQGNIEVGDWSDYVKEIYGFYNRTKAYPIKKRHMFFSCPLGLAFGLGVALDGVENISVYNYFRDGEYFRVFDVGELFLDKD